ncbi:MAG TPA: PEP-CTERM sorting domain-containing protein [Pirellulales bacterium]
MNFRGISAFLVAALSVVVIAGQANAAKLVVTDVQTNATNPLIPVGEKIFSVGILMQASDPAQSAIIASMVFGGSGGQPIQASSPAQNGVKDLQALVNKTDQDPPIDVSLPRAIDTFWYAGTGGTLTTSEGGNTDPPIALPSDPSLSGHGFSANPNANIWNPQGITGAEVSGNTSGTAIQLFASWGPSGTFVSQGTILPLVQIAATGNVSITVGNNAQLGPLGLLVTGNGALDQAVANDVFGHPYNTISDSGNSAAIGAYISFNPTTDPKAINATAAPEPSTLALAGLGLVGALLVRRRRK